MPDLERIHNLAGALRERATQAKQPEAQAKKWFTIKNATSPVATIHIYDMIGDWGVTASDFVDALSGITADQVELHINSEGGEVFDGLAIYESIKRHPATFTGMVDGLAASAASFIACACDSVQMARNARMMVHDAAIGGAYGAGNETDMRAFAAEVLKLADLLADTSDNIADIYAQKAGGTVEQWRATMRETTWYSAHEAVAAGLADGIIGEDSTPDKGAADVAVTDTLDFSALFAALTEGFK